MSVAGQFNEESSAVQTHLNILHDVISRMARNSASCKTWCVTLVAATLVLIARLDEPNYAITALLPTIAFLILDAYYLSLERRFRRSYDTFVHRLHSVRLEANDIYTIQPIGSAIAEFLNSLLRSFSILPFYGVVSALVIIVWILIL